MSVTPKIEYFKNTNIPLYRRLRDIKGTYFLEVKNYDDSRILIPDVAQHIEKNKLTASWSGGKDSTVMIEGMFRDGLNPLVVLCDLGYEFDETYIYLKSIIKRWQDLYNATVVIVDTQYFFLNRLFTANTKGEKIGLTRGFPLTLGVDYCTRDGKIRSNNYFIETNNLTGSEIKVAVGYAYDEKRSVEDLKLLKFIYPLKEKRLIEREVLALTVKWDIYNPYYDFYFRGGCIGCPKQAIDQLKKTWEFYPCQWAKWVLIESELHRLFKMEEIANPYMFIREDEKTFTTSIAMTSRDLIEHFKSHQTFGIEGHAKEISCMCA